MKKTLFTFIFILLCFIVNAQKSDSTHTHYAFYRGFSTHETELKSKRGILNGEYIIYNGRKNIGAIGNYKNDERVGRWVFYSQKDSIDQIYNYTTKILVFNRPDKRIRFHIDSLKDGDRVVYPAKIMGYLGLFLLTRNYTPPFEIQKKVGEFNLYFIFTLDKDGKLIKYETKVASLNFNKVEAVNLKKLKPEDFDFSPARVNGKNVASVMIFESTLGVNLNH
ncbi:hypothetical protein EZ428_16590 [Pedobacter frigiditerrae]|uniref:TonB C-terminal domain-containing protein n=1 Tax=Pedobacter frigiditerrae TaxID=2530452 RepID=A0A4R0MSV7_9SPHI|nr:hypothetical protein [Pedobacter frigiditerrae]TCC89312.1 hypothetical protein EZ428_16590 [Pedobacter frigiditerrae]